MRRRNCGRTAAEDAAADWSRRGHVMPRVLLSSGLGHAKLVLHTRLAAEDAAVDAARDTERRHEHVHQHHEVEQVGGGVLPQRHLAERQPLQLVLGVLLDAVITITITEIKTGLTKMCFS